MSFSNANGGYGCNVCHDTEADFIATVNTCQHSFHEGCLIRSLQIRSRCPNCLESYGDSDIIAKREKFSPGEPWKLKLIDRSKNRSYRLENMYPTTTGKELKEEARRWTGFTFASIEILYKGRNINNDITLSDMGVNNGAMLDMTRNYIGGMKKA